MRKKLLIFGFIIMFILVGTLSVAQKIELKINHGKFDAQLGFKSNDRPTIQLEGEFVIRGRIRVVKGSFVSSDDKGRFQGLFIGYNFYIKTTGRTKTIFGQIRMNRDYSTFNGTWKSRGIDDPGWIKGEFITRS